MTNADLTSEPTKGISGVKGPDPASTQNTTPKRFLLVGVGPFAKRIYIPRLLSLASAGRAVLVAAVEVEDNRSELEEYRQKTCPGAEFVFVPHFTTNMPRNVSSMLTRLVERLEVSCVIISTEPLAHCAYGHWALGMGLNVVMDKPISTHHSAVSSFDQAMEIASDVDKLLQSYHNLQTRKSTCFLINSHRRYHVGFRKATELVQDVSRKTGCPVTSIYTLHCDGQWRLPSEIVEQDYHTYNRGYGKVSHSGYHSIDCIYLFMRSGMSDEKYPDRVEVVSSFIQPPGFLFQVNENDYKNLFGEHAYNATSTLTTQDFLSKTRDFGEIDASIQLTFYNNNEPVALVHLDLQHTGFGRRTWLEPGKDLYKGNGRVRHEMHEIKSGPFQSVILESRQSSDKHDIIRHDHAELGGNGHFDLKLFQNSGMLGNRNPLRVSSLNELIKEQAGVSVHNGNYSRSVKYAALDEALEFMEGKKSVQDLISNLPDHQIPAYLMSAIYMSHVQRKHNSNPIISLDLSFDNE
ncbi:hypothetical protein ACLX1H_005570 [Fusarium chlamydosporum]